MVMMELLDCQNGIKIYKYEKVHSNKDSLLADIVFCFYHNNELLCTQTNPNFNQICDIVDKHKTNEDIFLTLEK